MPAAVMLEHLRFWCSKNQANEVHEHDGLYWTYNSIKAYREIYPYLSDKQIRAALKKLEDGGYIATGNFSSNQWDRTKWYAVTDLGYALLGEGKKGNMHLPSRANGDAQKGNCYIYKPFNTLPRKEDISGEEEFGASLSSEEDFLVGMGPTVDEVRAYCSANLLDRVDPELFVAYYDARGWVDKGGVRIVNWQAACRTWHIRDRNSAAAKAVSEEGRFDHLADGWERG